MFDLDGTLANTLADIAVSANHALSVLGKQTIEVARYRMLIGDGAEMLMTRALGPGQSELVPTGLELFHRHYTEHGLDFVKPYDGIPDLLKKLVQCHVPMAILSNKPDAAVKQVVHHLFANCPFAVAHGYVDGPNAPSLKPDPAAALAIADQLDIPPDAWLFAGDTCVDMQTANAAGMHAVGVLWGFRDEPELRQSGAKAIIQEPLELMQYIDC